MRIQPGFGSGSHRRSGEKGFTLIEIIVALVVIGIILGLAMVRYVGVRRNVFLVEADESLNELKTLAWGHYLQHGTWSGITSANMATTLGFQGPEDAAACWDYGLAADGTVTEIQIQATGDATPLKCLPVNGAIVTLALYVDGSSTRDVVYP